jgi:hypothetical protein
MNLILQIIIINWNTRELLRQCLQSLLEATAHYNQEIIVVDNGSSDGSPEMVKTEFPEIHLIALKENLGFARANNIAFNVLKPSSYVLLLNPDTIPTRKVIDELILFLDKNPSAGAVGPALIYPNGRAQAGGGYFPSIITITNYCLFFSHISPLVFKGLFINHRQLGHLNSVEVDWLAGTCLLVRREIIDQVKGFNEAYFIYGEDLEWSERIKKSGWKIFYLPQTRIIHYQGASLGENSSVWIKSLIKYIKERKGVSYSLFFRFMAFIGFTLRMLGTYLGYLSTQNLIFKDQAKKMFIFLKGTLS